MDSPSTNGEAISMTPLYRRILESIPHLPDTAFIPLPVAEVYEGCSRQTIERTYRVVQISEHRKGVLLGDLRRKREAVTA
jgi:hypothetical protein